MDFRAHASSSAGNLYEVACREGRLLIDPGLRIDELRRALGYRSSRVTGCLVTHHHADHRQAVPKLLRSGVDVYASAGTWEALALRSHRAYTVAPRQEFRAGPFRVLPFDTRHDAAGALGFLIGTPDGDRLLFAVDTAYIPYRFAGLTHIALEANYGEEILLHSQAPPEQKRRVLRNHMSIERAVRTLQANDLRQVREIHLLHLSDRHADAREFRAAVQRATGKPVYVAPRRGEEAKRSA